MYDQFYGLTGRPFQLTPDPRYYFESGTHRKALSYLGYGLAQGEGFIVITGEVGAGKSTLVAHLMQTIDKSRLTAANIVTSHLDGKDMVQMTAESFGISSHGKDKAETLKAIESHLHSEARAGRRCLLIVDEAQNLTVDAVEELRMLSNFQLGSQALLQIFLLGQPEFRDLVQNSSELEQLRQRIIATHHLEAMEADEVEPYVIHRLTTAGWNGNPKITSEAFSELYAETEGVPRKLNTLMSRVMLMGAIEQVHVIEDTLVKAVIADMAGKPFEYQAPVSSRAPISETPNEQHEQVQEDIPAVAAKDAAMDLTSEMTEIPVVADEEPLSLTQAIATETVTIQEPEESITAPKAFTEEPKSVFIADNEDSDDISTLASAELAERFTALEKRVADQDEALRRLLEMMIDWMDKESSVEAKLQQASQAA